MTHRYVQALGQRFHVAEAGTGEPVLMLHTFPQHWYAWRHVARLLADDYRVICLDHRGFGWSDAPRAGYTTKSRAADVLAVMDAMGLHRARLIAHGWGAVAGWQVCLTSPDRITHFMVVSMTHPWVSRRAALRDAWRQWHTAFWECPGVGRQVLHYWPGFTRFILRHWAVDAAARDEATLTEYAESHHERTRARAGEKLNWEYVLRDIPRLTRGRHRAPITVPALILTGERDVVIPPRLVRSGRSQENGVTVIVEPGAGHLLPEERPERVAEVARELFARN